MYKHMEDIDGEVLDPAWHLSVLQHSLLALSK